MSGILLTNTIYYRTRIAFAVILLFLTINSYVYLYSKIGDRMKVKIFDFEDEKDLEDAVNSFLSEDMDLIDIKYQVSSSIYSDEQIYCFSAMIIYICKE